MNHMSQLCIWKDREGDHEEDTTSVGLGYASVLGAFQHFKLQKEFLNCER